MSLLLDALNKADQERKRNEATPGINSNHEQINNSGSRRKTLLIALLVITAFLIVTAGIYWLGKKSVSQPTAASTATTAPTTQQKSIAPALNTALKSSVITSKSINDSGPTTGNSQDDIDTSDESVANLYQQNIQTQTANAALAINTPPSIANTTENSAPTDQNAGSTTSITQFANLPDLHDLPNQILEKIPSLNYSEHNFNANGGSVKINGNIHHANDQLAPGLVIDKILEDGMILHTDNYSFKMRALNSWVNM